MGEVSLWIWLVVLVSHVNSVHSACQDLPVQPIEVQENTTNGTIIYEDKVAELTVIDSNSVVDGVNTAQGWGLKLNKDLDAEKLPSLVILIMVNCKDDITDVGNTKRLSLSVKGINEFPPVFKTSQFTESIEESTPIGTTIFTFNTPAHKAVDDDVDVSPTTIAYKILSGDQGYFVIDSVTPGTVVVKKALDYENGPNQFILEVSAYEYDTSEKKSATATLQIDIEDVDDMNPIFSSPSYTLTVQEGVYTQREIATQPPMQATDGDLGINQTVTYKVDASTEKLYPGLFSVTNSGAIVISGNLTVGEYTLNIMAFQMDKLELRRALAAVRLTVTDINNHKPVMSQSRYTAKVSEGASLNTILLTVSASDDDQGENAEFEFILDNNNARKFQIQTNGDRGVIVLANPLDRETMDAYSLKVYARETKTQTKQESERSTIDITVTDENDNTPLFAVSSYLFVVKRTDIKDSIIGQVSASDADEGENGEVTYALQTSTFSPALSLDSTTGNLSLARDLDYSDVGTHDLTIIAADNSTEQSSRRTSAVPVTIRVSPVNDQSPTFMSQPYNFSVPETATVGSIVGQVFAEDPNGDGVLFTLDDPQGYFRIEMTSGKIHTAKSVDLDKGSQGPSQILTVRVKASDQNLTQSADVDIHIQYMNEFSPKVSPPQTVHVFENATKGVLVAKINATDDDGGPDGDIIFSLLTTPGSDHFDINQDSGAITLQCSDCLDFSLSQRYDLVIKVEDGGHPALVGLTTVEVDIVETVLSPPHFISQTFSVTIKEGTPAQFLLQLTASDPDTSEDQLIYDLARDSSHWVDVLRNGSVYSKIPFDAEQNKKHTIDVKVSDGASEDRAQIVIDVSDVNEYAPVLNVSTPLTIPENAVVGEVVTAVGATDDDITNPGFTFWLQDGGGGKFQLDPNSGLLTVSGQFDRRESLNYNLSVWVSDRGQPQLSSSSFVLVDISDSNVAPSFTQSNFSFQVREDENVGTVIGKLSASDPDQGSSGQLSFGVDSGNKDKVFSLDEDSGNLTLEKSLNFEENNQYILKVHVKDNSYSPGSSIAIVVVDVLNVVEAPQWPLPLPTVYLIQSATCNSQLKAFSREVTSVSSHGDEDVQYKIKHDPTGAFRINETSGLLQSTKKLPVSSIILELSACSRNTSVCSDANLTVVIQSDDILAFCPSFLTVSVNESVAIGETILDLSTNKKEEENPIVYKIISGNDNQLFKIDKDTGKISINSSLDRETSEKHTLLVSAKDMFRGETADAQVIVLVQDVADTVPKFTEDTYFGQILESASINDHVTNRRWTTPLIVKALDPDENSKVTYRIDASHDESNGSFSVDSSGNILLAKLVDYESMPAGSKEFSITIVAFDGMNETMAELRISVTDDNDNWPQFDQDFYAVNVSEDVRVRSTLIAVGATDVDTMDKGALMYSLKIIDPFGQVNPFSIRGNGEVIVEREMDREKVEKWEINVTVSDTSGHTNSTVLTVHVEDVNDKSPEFDQDSYSMNVTEGTEGLKDELKLKVFDADKGENGTLSLEIINWSPKKQKQDLFSISLEDNDTVILKPIQELDRETKALYRLVLQAVDHGIDPRSATCTVDVSVIDINDNAPEFIPKMYTSSVDENVNGTILLYNPPLNVLDPDGDEFGMASIMYSLNDSSLPFTIDNHTGDVKVTSPLDRETQSSYTLTILATDSEGEGHQGSAYLKVSVNDMNDEAPVFLTEQYKFSCPENSLPGTFVGEVQAQDRDINPIIVYSLEGGVTAFSINATGTLIVVGILDVETLSSYSFMITAYDGINSNVTTVVVSVTDTNDNAPEWVDSSLSLTMREDQGPPFDFGQVNATDRDVGQNGQINFSMIHSEWSSYFEVSPNGTVRLVKSLTPDLMEERQIQFPVLATDLGDSPQSSTATVTIKITEINDHAPQICYNDTCHMNEIVFSITDGSPLGSVIGHIEAYDEDQGKEGKFTFSLENNPPKLYDLFAIDNNGILKIKTTLNLRSLRKVIINGNMLMLNLTVSDQGDPPLSNSTTVQVYIISPSKNTPNFTEQSYSMNIMENMNPGTSVGNIKAISPSNSSLTYNIPEDVPFRVNLNSGLISTMEWLDRENVSSYHFIVSVHDEEGLKAKALVEVTVTDANDHTPMFDTDSLSLSVQENKQVPLLTTLQAQDDDTDLNGKVTYTLLNQLAYPEFKVNHTSGVLSIITPLDRENVSSYTLWIQAEDRGKPPESSNISILVTVEDVNDNGPVFTQKSYAEVFSNLSVPNQEILYVEAEDADADQNGMVTYTLEPTPNYWRFFIEPIKGVITNNQPLDLALYELVVRATDGGNPAKFSRVNVTLEKLNGTEMQPSLTLSVSETTLYVGMRPERLLDVKMEASNTRNVQITGGNDEQLFQVKSGRSIQLVKPLERASVYLLTITAFSETSHRTSQQLKVQVQPIAFENQSYSISVQENVNVHNPESLLKLNSNADKFNVQYSLDTQSDAFLLDDESGLLSVIRSLDRERQAAYVLDVSVRLSDGFPGAPSAITKVIVTVEDVNDNPPSFGLLGTILEIKIPQNVAKDYLVAVIKAFDQDDGENAELRYSIIHGSTELFSLQDQSGELRVIQPEKLKTLKEARLTVKATDQAGKGSSATLNVTVIVVPDVVQYILTGSIPLSEYNSNADAIKEKLSEILDYQIVIGGAVIHSDKAGSDPSRTDIAFSAFDPETNASVPISDIHSKVSLHQEAINGLFASFTNPKGVVVSSSDDDYSAVSIALIVVGCFMFVASLGALAVAVRLWKKQKEHQMKEQSAAKARQKMEEQQANGKLGSVSDPDEHLEMTTLSHVEVEIVPDAQGVTQRSLRPNGAATQATSAESSSNHTTQDPTNPPSEVLHDNAIVNERRISPHEYVNEAFVHDLTNPDPDTGYVSPRPNNDPLYASIHSSPSTVISHAPSITDTEEDVVYSIPRSVRRPEPDMKEENSSSNKDLHVSNNDLVTNNLSLVQDESSKNVPETSGELRHAGANVTESVPDTGESENVQDAHVLTNQDDKDNVDDVKSSRADDVKEDGVSKGEVDTNGELANPSVVNDTESNEESEIEFESTRF